MIKDRSRQRRRKIIFKLPFAIGTSPTLDASVARDHCRASGLGTATRRRAAKAARAAETVVARMRAHVRRTAELGRCTLTEAGRRRAVAVVHARAAGLIANARERAHKASRARVLKQNGTNETNEQQIKHKKQRSHITWPLVKQTLLLASPVLSAAYCTHPLGSLQPASHDDTTVVGTMSV